ncbi:STAS/SEC14 domain-containing protein [Aidingimonas halophila]|uniref:SpoIIAA-like n=1 Tax=Aidingimonas halophila TaxID=574349 RepID=A0A1H3ERZ6_9GAMM|nr:STAS/SEC14 domain-containing protein [Aidingimonas halophila]SDX80908.1 SpoIIAA-like [Aidingimonas halophila]
MIELLPPGAAHVVAFRASGRVTADDLQHVIDAIEGLKEAQPRISLYAEIDAMRWMTLSAVLRDLGYGLTQLGDLRHFYRAAIVTDRHWVRPIAHLETRLFKPLEVRAFPMAEREPALEWVRHLPEAPDSAEVGEAATAG